MVPAKELAEAIAQWAYERRAEEVVVMEVGQVSHITDYFVIMHASNRVLAGAIVEAIIDEARKVFKVELPLREGLPQGDWMLIDFGTVVVHVFLEETRRFFDLERLWVDAPFLPLDLH